MVCNLRRHVKVRYAVFAVYALGLILAIWAFWLEPANPIKQAHRPELPPRIALTIAGHTHGGQVYIPFVGRLIVPSRYGERYAIDHIIEQGRHLFVSTGLGTSILPVHSLVPPEVSVLTLQSGLN